MKRLGLTLAICLIATPVLAQTPRPKPALTGDIIRDTKTNLGINSNPGSGPIFDRDAPASCNFNLFTSLKADTLLAQIKTCVKDKFKNGEIVILNDTQAALDSATKFGDQPGIACLKPGFEILKAGVGTPAVPAVPEIPATSTSPAIPAVPAIDAIDPGLILLFQKFREFELSGGPSACKTWVNSTIAGANPLTQ